MFTRFFSVIAGLLSLLLMGCNQDEGLPAVKTPETYSFTRDGNSSVFFGGQTDRLNQLSEIKNYLKTGDAGDELSAAVLLAMYENADDNGGGHFSFESDRQLKNKTYLGDVTYFEALFDEAEAASKAGAASNAVAGYIARESGNNILVDGNGHEFTQSVEKGIMGSVFLYQIFNVYLTEDRIGDDVENNAVDGENNYTAMEHHWDEAFGYFGVPTDFPTTPATRFWGNYCQGRDALFQTNALVMDAFKKGRAAIVANRHDVKWEQRDQLYYGFELIAAATAVHYLNAAKAAFSDAEIGEGFHVLTEGYMFIRALKQIPVKKITDEKLDEILDTQIGENFWDVAESDLSGLTESITILASAYSEIAPIKDNL